MRGGQGEGAAHGQDTIRSHQLGRRGQRASDPGCADGTLDSSCGTARWTCWREGALHGAGLHPDWPGAAFKERAGWDSEGTHQCSQQPPPRPHRCLSRRGCSCRVSAHSDLGLCGDLSRLLFVCRPRGRVGLVVQGPLACLCTVLHHAGAQWDGAGVSATGKHVSSRWTVWVQLCLRFSSLHCSCWRGELSLLVCPADSRTWETVGGGVAG